MEGNYFDVAVVGGKLVGDGLARGVADLDRFDFGADSQPIGGLFEEGVEGVVALGGGALEFFWISELVGPVRLIGLIVLEGLSVGAFIWWG